MTKVEPELTVIVPTYNQPQYLEARINSIVKQSIVPASIIVIDDHSDQPYLGDFDKLCDFKTNSINFKYIINKERNGIATKTWLQGVQLVDSKYVWIAEGDDLTDSRFVEYLLAKTKLNNLDFATCQSFILDDREAKVYKSRHKNLFPNVNWTMDFLSSFKEAQYNFLYLGNPIENVGSCIFKTSSVLHALEKSRHSSNLTCDWEVYLNFKPSDNFGFFSDYLNIFRDHQDSQRSKTSLSQTNQQITELTSSIIIPEINYLINGNILMQVLINLMRNNPLSISDDILNMFTFDNLDCEIKDRIFLVNDSSSNYAFQEKVFANNFKLLNNFYSLNYLIDLPLFSAQNMQIINARLTPRLIFVFDVYNLDLVLTFFPQASLILFFDESDKNFIEKLFFASKLKLTERVFIVFCGQNIERIDNVFVDNSILQYSRLNHDGDTFSDFDFNEFLNFLNGILLSDPHSRSK